QRQCLRSILGSPGSGERPSREQMTAAQEECGIERPSKPPFAANLSEEDHECLRGQLGDPFTRRQRPSRQEMQSALQNCGIEQSEIQPQRGACNQQAFDQLEYEFSQASESEEHLIREDLHELFQCTDNEALRAQIRDFFYEANQTASYSATTQSGRKNLATR
ncbi:MAG: hypothetical protein AAF202_02550, partial [Pseudomonadota bacterium]